MTKVSVITKEDEQCKSALCHPYIFPAVCIVDPELMTTLPKRTTASTGWDVFTHAFESYINTSNTPPVDRLALEAIAFVVKNLPRAIKDGKDIRARSAMAWADTLAGICIANVGTTLPHAMGQPISGHFPHVTHGQSLAVVCPAFTRFTWKGAKSRFADVARIFNPRLKGIPVSEAAERCCVEIDRFLKKIGMSYTLEQLRVGITELPSILDHCMAFPDTAGNPVVPDREQIMELYQQCRRAQRKSGARSRKGKRP